MSQDEDAIRGLVGMFIDGWNAGDGHACARPFAENADFTAVTGQRIKGRDMIGRGHAEILSTVFKGTRNSAVVNEITFLRPDVAVADVTFRIQSDTDKPWLPAYTSAGLVATKEHGAWSIAVFRNLVPFERPIAGPLDWEILEASRMAAGIRFRS
ncbi:MAG TPA: SgcJ/EcaC family oxidoreductase [Bryobacteraceae bacterium]|nr:SgcJ/EcaC family oxidoreductase [Bryobacteraceae bacterium]